MRLPLRSQLLSASLCFDLFDGRPRTCLISSKKRGRRGGGAVRAPTAAETSHDTCTLRSIYINQQTSHLRRPASARPRALVALSHASLFQTNQSMRTKYLSHLCTCVRLLFAKPKKTCMIGVSEFYREGDQHGLQEARHEVPPGPDARGRGGRGEVQGDRHGLRGAWTMPVHVSSFILCCILVEWGKGGRTTL